MNKTLIILTVSCFVLFSCGKKKNDSKPYSYWTVNGEHFQSNQTVLDVGNLRTDFGVYDLQNDLKMSFNFRYLPLSDSFPITNDDGGNPAYANIGVHFHGGFYNVKYNLIRSIIATNNNGKARLTMSDVWFKGFYNADDSILVSCEFNAY